MTSELYEKINEIKDQISQIEKEQRLINPNNYFETDIKIKKRRKARILFKNYPQRRIPKIHGKTQRSLKKGRQ